MDFKYLLCFVIIAAMLNSCASTKVASSNQEIADDYTSVFPNKEVSGELESIINSIKMINNITFYKRYDFQYGLITKQNMKKKGVIDKAFMVSNINKTSSGTGTIISVNGSNVALLTAAHIVSYPDTILGYYSNDGVKTKYIQSIGIKVRQQIYTDLPDGGGLRLIAKDEKSDIAVVGNIFTGLTPLRAPVLKFDFGSAKNLQWGSIVYIFGFPVGNKMVTRGIVSSPNKDGNGRFLVDAVINRGSSGGLVFAIRGRSPNFELVGMVSAVPADREFVIAPYDPDHVQNLVPGMEYKGRTAIKRIVGIKYGIGKIISVEMIQDFFKERKEEILKKGFDLTFL